MRLAIIQLLAIMYMGLRTIIFQQMYYMVGWINCFQDLILKLKGIVLLLTI